MSSIRAMTAEQISSIDGYTLGDTFTAEELDLLGPYFCALNASYAKLIHDCFKKNKERDVVIRPSDAGGHGLVCLKGAVKNDRLCFYAGTIEVDQRYKGRRDRAISLPSIKIPPQKDSNGVVEHRGVSLKVILCGSESGGNEVDAVMINHACLQERVNAEFTLVPLPLYKNLDAREKVRELMDKNPYKTIPSDLMEMADEVLFTYFAVIVTVTRRIRHREELRLSYNQPTKEGVVDNEDNYFMPEEMARRKCKSYEAVFPCMCEPGGCPGNRFFILQKNLSAGI